MRRRSLALRSWHGVEYALLLAIAGLLTLVPVRYASSAMGRLWQIIGPLTKRHGRIGRNLSTLMPEAGAQERRRIAAEQWNNLGRTFAETVRLRPLGAEFGRVTVSVAAELDQKLLAAQGVVFVSCHSANWEAASYPMRRYGELMGLYQPLSNPLSDRFVKGLRERALSARMLPKTRDTSAEVMKWVRSGQCVGMLADLYEKRGIAVTFFGQPTRANPFPAMVARRLDVPLVGVRTIRLPGARFRLELEEIAAPRTADVKADIQATTQAILDRIEVWIRERPGEWMWVQRRWDREKRKKANAAKS